MNDEASSSTAAAHYTPSRYGEVLSDEAAPTAAELEERRKKNRRMFNRKRAELLDDLLRNMDILVYAQLSGIYYMDCSFLRFLLRSIIHFLFLTPKPAPFPQHPEDKPVIGGLFVGFLVCITCHVWFEPPSAGEVTRGYLHGGLAMDFIGQKGPSSKFHLVLLDLLVIGLQIVQLAASMTRRKLDRNEKRPAEVGEEQNATATDAAQDLDAEERGVRREEEQQDIEMQTLNPVGTATDPTTTVPTDSDDASDPLLSTTAAPRTDAHIFDAFHSGQVIIADLDIWKRLVEQAELWKNSRNAASSSSSLSGRTFRGELAGTVLRLRLGTDRLRQAI